MVLSDLLAEFRSEFEAGPAETMTEESVFAAAGSGDFGPLLALLDRRAATGPALDAILHTLPVTIFAGLVRHLSPAGATWILRTLDHLAMLHAAEALLPLSESGFQRLIRSLVLRDLLQAPRGRFDRRSWLRRLVEGLADEAGIPVPRMFGAIDRAMRRSARAGPAEPRRRVYWSKSQPFWRANLPHHRWRSKPMEAITDPEALARALDAASPEDRVTLLRQAAADPALLMRLVAATTEARRPQLLAILHPVAAGAMAADLRAFVRLHGEPPSGAHDTPAFEQFAWMLALTFLAGLGGGFFERRAFLRYLLDGAARFLGVPANGLATSLRRGFGALEPAGESADSPAALIDAVARERLEELARPRGPRNVGVVNRDAGRRGNPIVEETAADADALARALDAAGPGDTASPGDALALLRRAANDPASLMGVGAATDEAGRRRLLSTLDPVNAGTVTADLRVFVRLHAAVPLVACGRAEFGRLAWMLALNYVAGLAWGALRSPGFLAASAGRNRARREHDGARFGKRRAAGDWRAGTGRDGVGLALWCDRHGGAGTVGQA